MPPLIQRIAVSAFKTFSKLKRSPAATPELKELTELVGSLTAEDINFDYDLIRETSMDGNIDTGNRTNITSKKAPVIYIHLWEDTVYSMGIFILRAGASLPLHDHPSMYGIIKVLVGCCGIQNYSLKPSLTPPQAVLTTLMPWQKDSVRCASKLSEISFIKTESEPCILTPTECNLHEIHALHGPMAFLDILAPPYDHATGSRECHYYKDLTKERRDLSDTCVLMEIPQPREFWCESAEYLGPKIDSYESGL